MARPEASRRGGNTLSARTGQRNYASRECENPSTRRDVSGPTRAHRDMLEGTWSRRGRRTTPIQSRVGYVGRKKESQRREQATHTPQDGGEMRIEMNSKPACSDRQT
jgi:hypothetical protein